MFVAINRLEFFYFYFDLIFASIRFLSGLPFMLNIKTTTKCKYDEKENYDDEWTKKRILLLFFPPNQKQERIIEISKFRPTHKQTSQVFRSSVFFSFFLDSFFLIWFLLIKEILENKRNNKKKHNL